MQLMQQHPTFSKVMQLDSSPSDDNRHGFPLQPSYLHWESDVQLYNAWAEPTSEAATRTARAHIAPETLFQRNQFRPALRKQAHTGAWRAEVSNNSLRHPARCNLHLRAIQTNLSYFDAVPWNAWQRLDCFHARCRAPPLHCVRQRFGNAGVCFWPVPLLR